MPILSISNMNENKLPIVPQVPHSLLKFCTPMHIGDTKSTDKLT